MQITDYLIIALHITKVYLKSSNTRSKDYLRVALHITYDDDDKTT